MNQMNSEEICLSSPFGKLVAKTWGDKNGRRVLLIHALQDNAATFEELIPHLPTNLYLVAIDLSSHGLSARIPKDSVVTRTGYIIEIRRWIKLLHWKSFSIIGHSSGAGFGILYAAYYPEEVERVVSIDYLFPGSVLKSLRLGKAIDMYFDNEVELLQPPSGKSVNTILDEYRSYRKGLSKETALKMIRRCYQLTNDDTYISMEDPRIRNFHLSYDQNAPTYIFNSLTDIRASVLVIRASQSFITTKLPDAQKKTLEILKKNCRFFNDITLEGNHYIHAQQPEETGNAISEFFAMRAN